jgi:hypothetical protein
VKISKEFEKWRGGIYRQDVKTKYVRLWKIGINPDTGTFFFVTKCI